MHKTFRMIAYLRIEPRSKTWHRLRAHVGQETETQKTGYGLITSALVACHLGHALSECQTVNGAGSSESKRPYRRSTANAMATGPRWYS